MKITLPDRLNDFTVKDVIASMEIDHSIHEITIDFSDLGVAYPIGTLAFAQYIKYNIINRNREFKYVSQNRFTAAIGYLTSVGFFKYLGADPPCTGTSRINKTYISMSTIEYSHLRSRMRDEENTNGNKMPIQEVIQEYSDNYSYWIFNKVEPVVAYCFREIIRNVFEHTNALYCSVFGQIYDKRDEIEICIADAGAGIRNTLARKYQECTDDEWALQNSILPGVTSGSVTNAGKYDNSGFGLYVLSEIAKKFGYMSLCSGEKLLRVDHRGVRMYDHNYLGTFVGLNLKYSKLLSDAGIIDNIIAEGECISNKLGINGTASTSSKNMT